MRHPDQRPCAVAPPDRWLTAALLLLSLCSFCPYVGCDERHTSALGDDEVAVLQKAGYLSEDGDALDHYVRAILILKDAGADRHQLRSALQSDTAPDIPPQLREAMDDSLRELQAGGAKRRAAVPRLRSSEEFMDFRGHRIDVADFMLPGQAAMIMARLKSQSPSPDERNEARSILKAAAAMGLHLKNSNNHVLRAIAAGNRLHAWKMLASPSLAGEEADRHTYHKLWERVNNEFQSLKRSGA